MPLNSDKKDGGVGVPRLSVIVPVYNSEKYLARCVASILSQSMSDFELLLVDDGSTDGSLALCREYADCDSRVRVLHQVNQGQGAARNAALGLAQGEYITFVDSDDWIEQGLFADALERIREQKLDILCFETTIVKGSSKRICSHFSGDKVWEGAEALRLNLINAIDNSPCNKIYRRELWQQVQFVKRRTYEDVATVYRVIALAKRVGYMQKAYYNYLKHPHSTTAGGLNVRSRYEHFLGYKDRYEFAVRACPAAIAECEAQAVKRAVAVLTAVAAREGRLTEEQEAEVLDFIKEHRKVSGLDLKSKVLAWGACHCRLINTVYGQLSLLCKKIRT